MKSIFIIEDHPVMLDGLADYFAKTGRWKVTGTASSLAEAKKQLTVKAPDVILIDIQLEDGWGLDIINEFTAYKLHKPLMAVYSSFDGAAYVSAALGMGVRAYITKRKNEKQLEDALLKAMQGSIYIDETANIKLNKAIDKVSLLTKREKELMSLIKRGLSNPQIANQLGISRRTVENILSCVYDKTGIKSRIELERFYWS